MLCDWCVRWCGTGSQEPVVACAILPITARRDRRHGEGSYQTGRRATLRGRVRRADGRGRGVGGGPGAAVPRLQGFGMRAATVLCLFSRWAGQTTARTDGYPAEYERGHQHRNCRLRQHYGEWYRGATTQSNYLRTKLADDTRSHATRAA